MIFTSILLGWEIPLLPIQLLWLNLVSDSFPAMALGVEPAEPNIMNQPPRDTKEGILDKSMYGRITFIAVTIAASTLLAYYWAMAKYGVGEGLIHARTIAFTTLITSELLRAFSSRSQDFTLLKIGVFTNIRMVQAVLASFLLTVAVLYVPFLNDIFNVVPLNVTDWGIVLAFAFVPVVAGELFKMIFNNK